MLSVFNENTFTLKKKVLALTGKISIFNKYGALILYSQQKLLKLKEEIRVYTDETMMQEVLLIQARQVIDFSASYDVVDTTSNLHVGTLRRKGFRSMMRDEWEIHDQSDQLIGVLQEDSIGRALLRRMLLGSLLPQDYDLIVNDQIVGDYRQKFNLFRYELNVDLSQDINKTIDRRLVIALGVLLGTIEGKQSN